MSTEAERDRRAAMRLVAGSIILLAGAIVYATYAAADVWRQFQDKFVMGYEPSPVPLFVAIVLGLSGTAMIVTGLIRRDSEH